MIRFFFIRVILPLLIFWLLRALFKSVGESMKATLQTKGGPSQGSNYHPGGELKKDPVCGTYVSPGAAITRTVNGEVLHFCSAGCRDKYKA